MDPGFRLFITALPSIEFPLGLLQVRHCYVTGQGAGTRRQGEGHAWLLLWCGCDQMCTKVTNEPPAGLKAGILRSYTVIVDQVGWLAS